MGVDAQAEPGAAEPTGTPPANLDALLDALDELARLLPEGHELFTAVSDRRLTCSDLLLRNSSGATAVRLGLAEAEHAELAAMVASLSRGFLGHRPPRFPAELMPAGPGADGPGLTELEQDTPAIAELGQDKLAIPELEHDSLAVTQAEARAQGSRDDPLPARTELGADFRTMVEASPVPLMLITVDGMIEYAAPAIVPMLGVDAPEVLEGLFLAQLLHPEDRERFSRVVGRCLLSQEAMTLTLRLRRWDAGSYVRAGVDVRALPSQESLVVALGTAPGGPGAINEVLATERRQRALAGAADVGTALIGAAAHSLGVLIDLNPAFASIIGETAGALVGATLWELVADADTVRVEQAVDAVIDGRGLLTLEVRLAGEQNRRASMVLGPDRSSGDPPSLATVLLRDLTVQHGPLNDLKRTVARLERQNRELAEFARVTAHDLMAPLRALSGLMDILSPQLGEQSEDALLAVQTAIARMLGMVDGAVGFADAQAREPEHAPVDLSATLDRVLAILGADIVGANADVSVGELPRVTGDDIQLERLLASLVTNALSYSGEDPPQIEIAAAPEGRMWRITVSDQGIGVPPEARESIFGLFERRVGIAERRTTGREPERGERRVGSGAGIGLATARQIAEQHGGRIWVEPNHPNGSVFAFTLPAA